jgi:hypothetical protein
MRRAIWMSRSAALLFALAVGASPAGAQSSPRPAALIPLYVSYGTLQGFDVHSTLKARAAGGREINPLITATGGSTPALVITKTATTAGVVFAAERLRRSHPKGAVVLMVCANAALAAVVAHNYAVSRGAR